MIIDNSKEFYCMSCYYKWDEWEHGGQSCPNCGSVNTKTLEEKYNPDIG